MEQTETIELKTNNGSSEQAQPENEQFSDFEVRRRENQLRDPHSLRNQRAEAEIHAISQALQETGWNRKQAARLLSISYRGLLYKIRQHNITRGPASQRPCLSEEGQ